MSFLRPRGTVSATAGNKVRRPRDSRDLPVSSLRQPGPGQPKSKRRPGGERAEHERLERRARGGPRRLCEAARSAGRRGGQPSVLE